MTVSKVKWTSFFITCLLSLNVGADCLPKVESLKLGPEFFACKADVDCQIPEEACRSCQPMAINKKLMTKFLETDRAYRQKANCLLSCEACSKNIWSVKCLDSVCNAKNRSVN